MNCFKLLLVYVYLFCAQSVMSAPLAYALNSTQLITIDLGANAVLNTLSLPLGCRSLVITPDGATIYVVNSNDDTVLPIDRRSMTVGTPIQVGQAPRFLTIDPQGTTVYVTNVLSNSITPIDTATGSAGAEISVGSLPVGIVCAPDGTQLYVACSAGVMVVDTATRTVLKTIPVTSPFALAVTPDGTTICVTTGADGRVVYIDRATQAVTDATTVGGNLLAIAIAPDGSHAYVCDLAANNVIPVALATRAAQTALPVGVSPLGIAITADGTQLYVANLASQFISTVSLTSNNVESTVPGNVGLAIALEPFKPITAVSTNLFFNSTEFVAKIGWNAVSVQAAFYRIYRNAQLASQVSACAHLESLVGLGALSQAGQLSISSVTATGQESVRIPLQIQV